MSTLSRRVALQIQGSCAVYATLPAHQNMKLTLRFSDYHCRSENHDSGCVQAWTATPDDPYALSLCTDMTANLPC